MIPVKSRYIYTDLNFGLDSIGTQCILYMTADIQCIIQGDCCTLCMCVVTFCILRMPKFVHRRMLHLRLFRGHSR